MLTPHPTPPLSPLLDQRQRPLHDLRISVTDRCNFRCGYCMPKAVFDKNYSYLPQSDLLSFEEITHLTKLMLPLGIQKVRLTGGEPLLRRHLYRLVAQLSTLRTPQGHPLEITLTTNGTLLSKMAVLLKENGLDRLTISLDALDDALFQKMNDMKVGIDEVLRGIETAQQAGFRHIKINMVVKKGVNDHQLLPMADFCRQHGLILRMIEYMDVGNTNAWVLDDVVPSSKILAILSSVYPLIPYSSQVVGETAKRYRYADGMGEIGLISSVTEAFCTTCNRLRLSTDGRLYLCLFAYQGHDIRHLLRSGVSDDELTLHLKRIWSARTDQYSIDRQQPEQVMQWQPKRRIEMSYIGG